MYKTVKHGENSLQYKILSQQEEGEASVKRRKVPRSTTIKLIVVIILLIVGIIASAVLVPLILTNDFIALTGTFQKFSVSTLRRSHSGNHVVVIAKKPYGWSAPHSSVPPKMSNSSLTHAYDSKKFTDSPSTTTEPTIITTPTTKATTTENIQLKVTSDQPERKQQRQEYQGTTAGTTGNNVMNDGMVKPSPTASVIQKGNRLENKMAGRPEIPLLFEPVDNVWSSGSSNNFIQHPENNAAGIPMKLVLGIFFFFTVIMMFLVLRKTLTKRKASSGKEAAESKEDKTRLLKPGEHEED